MENITSMMAQFGEEAAANQGGGGKQDVLPVQVTPGVNYYSPTDGFWKFEGFTELQITGDLSIADPNARATARKDSIKALYAKCADIAKVAPTTYQQTPHWAYQCEFFPQEFLTKEPWKMSEDYPTVRQVYDTRSSIYHTTTVSESGEKVVTSKWGTDGWDKFLKLMEDSEEAPAVFPSTLLRRKVWVSTKQIPVFQYNQDAKESWNRYTCQVYKADKAFDTQGNAVPMMTVPDGKGGLTDLIRSSRSTEENPVPMPKFQFWITAVVATDLPSAKKWIAENGLGTSASTGDAPTVVQNQTVLQAKLQASTLKQQLRELLGDNKAGWVAVCGGNEAFALTTWDDTLSEALEQLNSGKVTMDSLVATWGGDETSPYLNQVVFERALAIQKEVYS